MSNELKLSLENFQSISDGELTFHAGLNFIIGQSNSGKSATFRALKACLLNSKGSQRFIKKSTSKASVLLEYGGNQIIWKRTPKESSYLINGESYLKTGASSAFKILEDTGFVLNGNIMNIEEELQLPFPFGMSGAELFKLYEDVFCISDSAIILKSAKEQEDIVKSEISQNELDLNKCNLKISELESFKEEVDLNYLKESKKYLEENNKRLNILREDLPFIKSVVELSSMKLPSTEAFDDKMNKYKEALDTKLVLKNTCAYHKLLNALPEEQVFSSVVGEYNGLVKLKGVASTLNNLEALKLPKTKTFISKLHELKELRELSKVARITFGLKEITIPIEDFTSKLNKLQELKDYKTSLQDIVKKGKDLNKKYKEKIEYIKELKAKLKEFKVCPLCHRPLEGEKEC